MSLCLCGSNKPADSCCTPVIQGEKKALNAEDLMRARYCAFTLGDISFLSQSLHPDHRSDHDVEATRNWSEGSEWLGLEIVDKEQGEAGDSAGIVEFIATYKEGGVVKHHHERSNFSKLDDEWFFVDGDIVPIATKVNATPKIGRNEPCPCGSGKKYKKCCGK